MLKRKKIDLTFENILVDAELNILRWYDFTDQAKVLSVGWNHSVQNGFAGNGSIFFGMLNRMDCYMRIFPYAIATRWIM